MAVKTRTSGKVTILDVSGRLTIEGGDLELRDAVNEALDSGNTNLLLDMSGAVTIDSSGIGALVGVYTRTQHRGGKLKLLNLRPRIQDILHITQLIRIFEVFDSEQEAIDSFS